MAMEPILWMFPKIVGFPPKSSILIGFSTLFSPIHFGGYIPLFLVQDPYKNFEQIGRILGLGG